MTKQSSPELFSGAVVILCICCVTIASHLGDCFFQAACAQSADVGKLAKIEELYKSNGTQGRIEAQVHNTILIFALQAKTELNKTLTELKYPEQKVEELSNGKSEEYKRKLEERTAPLLREAAITFSIAADRILSDSDLDYLLNFCRSDAGKVFTSSMQKIAVDTQTPIKQEFKAYLEKTKPAAVAGSPIPPYQRKDYGSQMAAIKPERLALIKSTIIASQAKEEFAVYWNGMMKALLDEAGTEGVKKSFNTMLAQFDAPSTYQQLLILEYDKVFTDAQLVALKTYVTDPRRPEISKHLAQTEHDALEALGEKLEKVSANAYEDTMADMMTPAPGKK